MVKRMLGGEPPADLWPFYKELLATVEAAVVLKQPGIRYCYYFLIPWTTTIDPKHFDTYGFNIYFIGFLTDANI